MVASAGVRPGEVRYDVLRSDPPLLLRPTPAGLHLVGGAAGPLGGDELDLEVHVRAGARLRVRSAAASVVLPGAARSDLRIRATVATGGHLRWAPEPTISVRGSRHRQGVEVSLDPGATLDWCETLVLGRSDEPGGTVDATLRITRNDRPVVHQQLGCGDGFAGWDGPAGLGAHRVVATTVAVGAESAPAATHDDAAAGVRGMRVPLAADITLTQVVGGDVPDITRALGVLDDRAGGARSTTC